MTSVVNQWGRYLDGREREEVIHAHESGATALVIDGIHLEILGADSDGNGNTVIKVKVKL